MRTLWRCARRWVQKGNINEASVFVNMYRGSVEKCPSQKEDLSGKKVCVLRFVVLVLALEIMFRLVVIIGCDWALDRAHEVP